MLHRRFPEVKVTPQTLEKYFKLHGVKKKKIVLTKEVKWGKRTAVNAHIDTCRKKLQDYWDNDKLVLWLDECMLTTRTYQMKDWAPVRENREIN